MASGKDTQSSTGSADSSKGGGDKRQLTARGRDRRDALLEFATKSFAERGFHPTSVSDIVDGIGVGKGVFYWYFPSKDELLLEILREALTDLRRFQRSQMNEANDPLGELEAGIRASLAWSADNADVLRLVMFGWTEEPFAKALRRGRRIVIDDTTKLVAQAIEQGAIADGDPAMLATAIIGVTDELGRHSALGGLTAKAQASVDDFMDTAVRFCLRGITG